MLGYLCLNLTCEFDFNLHTYNYYRQCVIKNPSSCCLLKYNLHTVYVAGVHVNDSYNGAYTICRYETPGADVMKSFGKGIHKYVGLEVCHCIISTCVSVCV